MTLTRWDPFLSFSTVDRMFDEFFNRVRQRALGDGSVTGVLPIDVYETNDELVVQAFLPGAEPKDVSVNMERGTLTIQAHVGGQLPEEAEKQARWHLREIWRGDVTRALTLPGALDAEKATAEFRHGVLTLRIPKAETAKPRQIPVHASS